jgi:predicted peptidase
MLIVNPEYHSLLQMPVKLFHVSVNVFGVCLLVLLHFYNNPVSAQQKPITIPVTVDSTSGKVRFSAIKALDVNVFKTGMYTGEEGNEIKYRLFSPNTSGQQKHYPLVIVLHGSGQVGTDNISQVGFLAKLFAGPSTQQQNPAYVLAPQFPARSSDYSLDSTRNVLASAPRSCVHTLLELVDSLKQALSVDPHRIYVVGYSMGGSTAINAMIARPDLFAAGISISGIPQFEGAHHIAHLPLWLIHGQEDDVNTIESDAYFFREFNQRNLLFWQLEKTKHEILMAPSITGDALPSWLFKQKRK